MIEYIEIDPYHPRPDLVRELTQALRDGELVACPTDTTYGVFSALGRSDSVARLTRLRQEMAGDDAVALRELNDKPPALIFADLDMMTDYVVLTSIAFKLVKRLLPGPYTIILPASRAVPKRLQSKRRHVGARIPDHVLTTSVVRSMGEPILSITAKDRSGRLLHDALTLSDVWMREIDKVVDCGPFFAEPSTVLDVEEEGVTLIRQGKGTIDSL